MYRESTIHPFPSFCRYMLQPAEETLADGGKIRATNTYEDWANVRWLFPCCP
jgi:hypothetical protein